MKMKNTVFYRPQGTCIIVLLMFCISAIHTQSPDDERWEEFISSHDGRSALPDDEILGALADRRFPANEWAGGIEVCETAFKAIEAGKIPEDLFYIENRFPLKAAFQSIQGKKRQPIMRRYGQPVRQANRLYVPVRIDNAPVIGTIYLIQSDNNWYIEQWSVDLSEKVKQPDSEDSSQG